MICEGAAAMTRREAPAATDLAKTSGIRDGGRAKQDDAIAKQIRGDRKESVTASIFRFRPGLDHAPSEAGEDATDPYIKEHRRKLAVTCRGYCGETVEVPGSDASKRNWRATATRDIHHMAFVRSDKTARDRRRQ